MRGPVCNATKVQQNVPLVLSLLSDFVLALSAKYLLALSEQSDMDINLIEVINPRDYLSCLGSVS